MLESTARVLLVNRLDTQSLEEVEAHHRLLSDAITSRQRRVAEIGDIRYLPLAERQRLEGERATLLEELRQLRDGVTPDEGYSENLKPFLGRPGLTATAIILERLRRETARQAVDPHEEHRYRLRKRADGSVAKFYLRTESGELRRLRPDETIVLSNERFAALADVFERVESNESTVAE